jgi:hypothetical protein
VRLLDGAALRAVLFRRLAGEIFQRGQRLGPFERGRVPD